MQQAHSVHADWSFSKNHFSNIFKLFTIPHKIALIKQHYLTHGEKSRRFEVSTLE